MFFLMNFPVSCTDTYRFSPHSLFSPFYRQDTRNSEQSRLTEPMAAGTPRQKCRGQMHPPRFTDPKNWMLETGLCIGENKDPLKQMAFVIGKMRSSNSRWRLQEPLNDSAIHEREMLQGISSQKGCCEFYQTLCQRSKYNAKLNTDYSNQQVLRPIDFQTSGYLAFYLCSICYGCTQP